MTRLLPVGTGSAVERMLTPEPERELPSDPVEWVRSELDEFLWSKQREIARSVMRNRRTMVPACHGPGKSMVASRIAAYWLESHEPGEAFVVTSAPTDHQVGAILWREIARAHRKGGLRGRITLQNEWYVGPRGSPELVAFGRKPADLRDTAQAMTAFQGIHARYVLVILDEATGIPPWLWDASDSLLTNDAARLLAIGNPDDSTSRFETECRPGSGAEVIRIPADITPNFTGERIPEHLREMLVSRTWVEERRERWGVDSPLYQSKVLARFPDTSDDAVIPQRLVTAAWERHLPGDEPGSYGLDVARFGPDQTVLYRVRGGVAREVDAWGKRDTVESTDRLQALTAHTPHVPIVVDVDGIGGSVYDQAKRRKLRVVPFSVQDAAHKPRRFKNRRSELWWSYRELMEDGLVDLDPVDLDLAAQLQQPKWWLDAKGRIVVESKDDMRDRGLPSPDRADAVIMAEFGPQPGSVSAPKVQPGAKRARKSQTGDLLKRPM